MTAYAPPPKVIVEDGRLSYDGELTEAAAIRHVAQIQTSLTSLEATIRSLPPSEVRDKLQYRVLRLHNHLSRGGQALNDHFKTAQVSPDSAGGDKDPSDSSDAQDV